MIISIWVLVLNLILIFIKYNLASISILLFNKKMFQEKEKFKKFKHILVIGKKQLYLHIKKIYDYLHF